MSSVTNYIQTVIQPYEGYLPPKLFKIKQFSDSYGILNIPAQYTSIVGIAVDYLSRMINGNLSAAKAFHISLSGAAIVDQEEYAYELINRIKSDLSDEAIISACKLACYDTAFRAGPEAFKETITVPSDVVQNVRIAVQRAIKMWDVYGPIVRSGMVFPGGYNDVINSGDADYATKDTLWDMKCSKHKPNIKNTLQLAIYYVLAVRSYQCEKPVRDLIDALCSNIWITSIKRLGILNPLRNEVYILELDQTNPKIFYTICSEVMQYQMRYGIDYCRPDIKWDWKNDIIGNYKICEDNYTVIPKDMREYDCISIDVLEKLTVSQMHQLTPITLIPEDNKDIYTDGVYRVDQDAYRNFCIRGYNERHKYHKNQMNDWWGYNPSLSRVSEIFVFIKNGYIMYVGLASDYQSWSILHNGLTQKLTHPLRYYWNYLDQYADCVKTRLQPYYAIIEELVEHCPIIERLHGCILDIDYYNHIFINPLDGTVIPYYAVSKEEKWVYPSIMALLQDKAPEKIPLLTKYLKQTTTYDIENVLMATEINSPAVLQNQHGILVTDTTIYQMSNKILKLQSVYEFNVTF